MAVVIRTTASPWLGVLMVTSFIGMVLFGALCASTLDWVLGAVGAIFGAFAIRLAWLQRKLRQDAGPADRASAPARDVSVAGASWHRAHVAPATYSVGARFRTGFVVFGHAAAGFVPTTRWRHLVLELLLGLFVARVRVTKVEMEATDSELLAEELLEVMRQQGGFLLDGEWSWAFPGRTLTRLPSNDYLTIDGPPPPPQVLGRWPVLPRDPTAYRRVVRKVGMGTGLVCMLMVAAGVIGWRLTGDLDFLIAGLTWAVLIGGAVTAGLVLAARAFARSSNHVR
jgi:hypothetical protein